MQYKDMRRKDINLIPDTDGLFVISIYVYVGKMHKLLPSKGNEVLGMSNINRYKVYQLCRSA